MSAQAISTAEEAAVDGELIDRLQADVDHVQRHACQIRIAGKSGSVPVGYVAIIMLVCAPVQIAVALKAWLEARAGR